MSIANDLISRALRTVGALGAGQTANANDMDDGLAMLNDMLDQWSLEGLMIYYSQTEQFSLVAGTYSYTIGASATFNTVRPVRIQAAQLRDSSSNDTNMRQLSWDDYQQIYDKDPGNNIPAYFCYQPANPQGTILIYPPPLAGYSIRLQSDKQFVAIADYSTDVALPPGYNEAIIYGLAERMCIEHGRAEMLDVIMRRSMDAKANIKRMNNKRVQMKFPAALTNIGGIRSSGTIDTSAFNSVINP